MTSSDVTRREFMEAAVVTGGALVGGQLMPGAISPAAAQGPEAAPAPLDVVLQRQRNRASADARSAHHAPRRAARAPASHRLEERLRPRPVRRLHRADGRQAREIVPVARRPRRGARDHDHRGPGARRRAPPVAGRLHRARRLPVRLLHVRADHGRRRLHRRGPCRLAAGNPRMDERQPLPLRRLRPHRRGHPGRGGRTGSVQGG